MKKELRQQIEFLEQKMLKSPNLNGSRYLYRREKMIRFQMLRKEMSQKWLAKYLNITESYVSKLITGERYNQQFEFFLRKILEVDCCFI